ncbi:N-6 DNA methylase [Sphingomonas sp. TZW2008]|uniref:N-6 DNA methylase n=1 Tax=Sphingomonas sp. TZW2008 TaxID=1917973 RepID=UPI000A26E691|nr:N-6 DNA methylase [Sphingomonas sp. TZW2008]
MVANKRAADIGLAAVHIEGSLIAPAEVLRIARQTPDDKLAIDYGSLKGTDLREKISGLFNVGRATWRGYDQLESPTVQQTAAFARSMLEEVFGFDRLTGPVDHEHGGHRYRIAWEAKGGRVPIVVAAPDKTVDAFGKALPEFGDGSVGSRAKRSPAVLLQDWLNANPNFYWGLVFAGDRVRLMRDNASFTRPAYIEADLGAIFRDEMYADFTALWLLIHASRFGAEDAAPSECALERWRDAGEQAGTEVRAHLRGNVEEALGILAQGFLDADENLRAKLDSGDLSMQDWFNQILRTVYRLIFLAVAEDRNLLHAPDTKADVRGLYADNYGFNHWRDRATRKLAYDHHFDNWETINIVFSALEDGTKPLGLPALGGLFRADQTPDLNAAKLSNRAFLEAVFRLAWFVDKSRSRINWRDMATEELGSVYESLLELVPFRENGGRTFVFAGGVETKGNARKTSGSYYTPDSLVQTLLDSALNPVLDRAERDGGAEAILKLKVIDPACGSGHFLLGAARRMANRVAQARNIDAPDYQAAMRDVVRSCIHGVDRNAMALELAKVALWIETVTPGKPLGFLDANIVCGDSLLGIFDLKAIEQGISDEAFKQLSGDDKKVAADLRKQNKAERDGQGAFDWASGGAAVMPPRKMAADVGHLRDLPEDTVAEVEAKRARFAAWVVDPKRAATQRACDLQMAAFLLPKVDNGGVFARPLVPTTATVRQVLSGKPVNADLIDAAVRTANDASVLHWPLAFPEVMIGRGGFDAVLGNPPWEVMQLGEEEYFASRDPDIAAMKGAQRKKAIANLADSDPALFAAYERDKRAFESANEFARAGGRFDLTARGKVNTYALFAEHFLNLTREGGSAGVIVPTGIATDATTAPFFGHLVSTQRLAGLTDFENSAPLFPGVHRSFKFCLLTIGSGVREADFAFFLTDPSQLEDARRRFKLSPEQIARINPNTKTAPVFRSQRDAELTAAIYGRVPVLIEEGVKDGNPWNVEFRQGLFNMTSDSGLFRTAAQLAAAGFVRDGTDWVKGEIEAAGSAATSKPRQSSLDLAGGRDANHLELTGGGAGQRGIERYVPLYESKMFDQFNHRYSDYSSRGDERGNRVLPELTLEQSADPSHEIEPFYWVDLQEARARKASENYLVGYGEATTATTTRTMVMTAFPFSGVGHKTILLFSTTDPQYRAALLANANALVLDYICRTKVSYLTLAQFIAKQLPFVSPTAYTEADLAFIVPRVLELTYTSHAMAPFARDLGYNGGPFAWDENRRADLRAELDAWYSLAYGLDRDELRYVLDPKEVMGTDYPSETFRVLQKNETAKYGEYRTRRLVLAAYDELIRQGMRVRKEGYRQK